MTQPLALHVGEVGRGLSWPGFLRIVEAERAKGRHLHIIDSVDIAEEAVGEAAEIQPAEVPDELPKDSVPIPVPKSARLAKRADIPPPGTITPTSPLRLSVACKLAFPDGSMSEKGLRELGHAGKLTVERIRGKDYTTLADIEEMRSLCRVQAKAQGSAKKKERADRRCGSSETERATSAQAALLAKVRKASEAAPPPKKSSANTSRKSTTPKKTGEVVSLKPQ
jgi:hypothetical protein